MRFVFQLNKQSKSVLVSRLDYANSGKLCDDDLLPNREHDQLQIILDSKAWFSTNSASVTSRSPVTKKFAPTPISNPTRMISDLTHEVTSIEKLEQFGPSSLDSAELLDLILGVRGNDCGQRVLQHFGRLSSIASADTAEIATIRGVGRAKAARLAAAFELLTRMSKERMADTLLDAPERIYEHFGPLLSHQPQERVMVATVDTRLRHISTTTVSIGSVNECTAHPRDVMRSVITRSAHGFVLVHNHPSGDPSPSSADHAITRRIADVASTMQVRFVDHVIIGTPCPGRSPFFSFREAGQIG